MTPTPEQVQAWAKDSRLIDSYHPTAYFARLAYAAGRESMMAELLAGVEMPEPWISLETTELYIADQLREIVAAAVLRKDAEMHQMGEDLIAIQTMHNEQKARLYEKCADLRNERDAIKAENERLQSEATTRSEILADTVVLLEQREVEVERLRADAARWTRWYPWIRGVNKKPFDLHKECNAIDAAMKGQS